MLGWENISVEFLSSTPLAVVLTLALLIGLTFLLYYRTNPPLPRYLRILMGALRVIAVLALVAALLEPVFSFVRSFERPRRVSVLIDHSKSMDKIEGGKTRQARLDSLLSGVEFERLKSTAEVTTFFFGENLSLSRQDVGRDKTALGDVVRQLERASLDKPSDDWLLFSDGNSNTGRRPVDAAGGLPAPITSVGMARDADEFDVGLVEIHNNPIVFVGQPTKIRVRFTWSGAAGREIQVQLRASDQVLSAKQFSIIEDDGFGELDLNFTPAEPGQQLIRVSIPILESESNDGNNSRNVALKALKSRMQMLLVAHNPDYEVGFLNRFLRQSDRCDIDLVLTGNKGGNLSGRFPTVQADLNRYDLVILYDLTAGELNPYQSLLRSYLHDKGGGAWFMMGMRFARGGLEPWISEFLPFLPSRTRPAKFIQFNAVPAEGQLFHPCLRHADDRAGIREWWASRPPFGLLVECDRTADDGVILAFASGPGIGSNQTPLLGYKRVGPGKVIASASLPFWNWGFNNIGFESDDESYNRFIEGTVSWLTVQDDFDPIRISPERDIFSRGEKVSFEGFAFDQGFRPIAGVDGEVELSSAQDGESYETDLIERGNGRHTAEFNQLPPGKYTYLARFEKDGVKLKEKSGEILVEAYSLEEFNQRGDQSSLSALSRATGGQYFGLDGFSQALASLDVTPIIERETGELVLWGRLWLLLLFVGALALEWVLRKSNHLI